MSERCGTHGKMRTIANLDDIGGGQFRCKSSSACKPGGEGPSTFGGGGGGFNGGGYGAGAGAGGYGGGKKGGNYSGGGGSNTSTAQLIAQGHVIVHPEQPEVCHAHGKRRSPRQLHQVMTSSGPQWECLVEARCKVSQSPEAGGHRGGSGSGDMFYGGGGGGYQRYAQGGKGKGKGGSYGGGFPAYGGHGGGQPDYCAMHEKKRSASCLEYNTATGRYQCKMNEECKPKLQQGGEGDGTTGYCTTHQKSRKLMYLISKSDGTYMCARGRECQVGQVA